MKQIAAGKFKAKCLELMDQVSESKVEITITKRGMPVAKLVPYSEARKPKVFGALSDTVVEYGDLVGPIEEDWEVASSS